MTKEYLTLNKIDEHKTGYDLGNEIWREVVGWDSFAKWTVGKQLVECADSISANIAEGFGRYHKKEKIHFNRYSYGSTEETRDWINKCKDRGLIEDAKLYDIYAELEKLPKAINQLIKYTNEKLKY